MSVGVINPGRRQSKDPLDLIQQGLQIAAGIYGIKADMAKMDDYQANKELQRKALEGDISYKAAQQKALEGKDISDHLSQKDIAEMRSKGWGYSEEPSDGAQQFTRKGGTFAYMTPPKEKAEKVADYRDISVFDPKMGQNTIVSVPKNQPLPAGYLAPRKDDKEQKTFDVTGVGQVKSQKDADQLTKSLESYANIKSGIQSMQDVRSKAGAGGFEIWDRGLVSKGTQAAQDLKFQYKDIVNLGVLSDKDAEALANIVPDDPTGMGPIDAKLKNLSELTDQKMANGLYQRGIPPEKVLQITGQLPTILTQGLDEAHQIALKEILTEKARMGSR